MSSKHLSADGKAKKKTPHGKWIIMPSAQTDKILHKQIYDHHNDSFFSPHPVTARVQANHLRQLTFSLKSNTYVERSVDTVDFKLLQEVKIMKHSMKLKAQEGKKQPSVRQLNRRAGFKL